MNKRPALFAFSAEKQHIDEHSNVAGDQAEDTGAASTVCLLFQSY